MKERRIRCTGSDVRAILEGKKTQTRTIAKMSVCGGRMIEVPADDDAAWVQKAARNPYGNPGDRLWVQETWQVVKGRNETESWEMPHIRSFIVTGWPEKIPKSLPAGYCKRYAADYWTYDERDGMDKPYRWRPSIFMPRWASRITLEITGVRVERLQQIGDADALAEGCSAADMRSGDSLASVYTRLWESIHGPGSWDANPWVWVVEFRKLTTTPAEP